MDTTKTTKTATTSYGFKVMDKSVIGGNDYYKLLEEADGFTTSQEARAAAEASIQWHKDLWSLYNVVGEVTSTVSTTQVLETLED